MVSMFVAEGKSALLPSLRFLPLFSGPHRQNMGLVVFGPSSGLVALGSSIGKLDRSCGSHTPISKSFAGCVTHLFL